jgi:hypothetical protein
MQRHLRLGARICGLEVHPLFVILNMSGAPFHTMLRHFSEPSGVRGRISLQMDIRIRRCNAVASFPRLFDDAWSYEASNHNRPKYCMQHTNISASPTK